MAEPLGLGLPLLLLFAGTALMLAEAVIPGAQFVVVGVAMFLAGLVGIALGGVFASIVALSLMTVAFGVFAYFAFREMELYNGPNRGSTSDSGDLSGNVGVVTERVDAHGGIVRLRSGGGFDPNYRARTDGDPIEEGEKVMVTDPGGGNVLTVQSMSVIEEDSIDRELARDRAASDGEGTATDETAADVDLDDIDVDGVAADEVETSGGEGTTGGADDAVTDGEGRDTDDETETEHA